MNIDFSFIENIHIREIPDRATTGSAGFDLYANLRPDEEVVIHMGEVRTIGTGIRLRIPETMVGLICSRSGLATKGVFVLNSPGVIDSDYRGEIGVILCNLNKEPFVVRSGMKIAQILFLNYPQTLYFNYVERISEDETIRGAEGFGSTGI